MASGPKGRRKKNSGGTPTPAVVQNANISVVGCSTLTNIPKSELARVCPVIDLEGVRLPNEWVFRSIKVDGLFIDPYLWGHETTFVVREMGWCPVDAPLEGSVYQYDHPIQKYDLPWPVYRSIKYAMRNVHGLALHPPEIALSYKWSARVT